VLVTCTRHACMLVPYSSWCSPQELQVFWGHAGSWLTGRLLHHCCTTAAGAARYGSFSRVTNPHRLEVEGVALLGTAGQNIDDMALYSRWGRWAAGSAYAAVAVHARAYVAAAVHLWAPSAWHHHRALLEPHL
jgi:hypothetical protein